MSTKRSRRIRGSGSMFAVVREGKELWIGRVPIGRKLNGQLKYREVQATSRPACAARMAAVGPPGEGTTVAEWSERWFAGVTVRESTARYYRWALDYWIVPTLGHLRAVELSAHQVETAIAQWLKRGLEATTAKLVIRVLNVLLNSARRAGLLERNPATDARKPKTTKPKHDLFNVPELGAIIVEASKRDITCLFALLASVGCRIGEGLALDVGDYDRAAKSLSIDKTYCGTHGTRPPKTSNGIRIIRVPGVARPAIDRAVGGRVRGPLFASRSETRLSDTYARDLWRQLLDRLELRYRSPHQLRHSVASHLIAAGAGIADVARDLGDHPFTVMKTYCHDTGVSTADVMERLLGAAKTRRRA